MKAIRIDTGNVIEPLGDPVGQTRILDLPLEQAQDAVLDELGIQRVESPPAEPYLLYSDRTWFTTDAVRRLLAAGPGRMRVQHDAWNKATGPLQDLPEPGLYELALHPGGQAPLSELAPVSVDLELREQEPMVSHPAMAHASEHPMLIGPALVHQVDHWSHVVRINLLALTVLGERARLDWEAAGIVGKTLKVLSLLFRARSFDKYRLARAACEMGPDCEIHPTAVVELCRLGKGVNIGPHAVVRASVLGDGVKIEEHATVNLAVLGQGAKVSRYGMVNLCTLYPGAQASTGGGYQVTLFGRDSFAAHGATSLDMSFGRHVRVLHRGEWVDSGHYFLGACIGHRALIGNNVRLNYGISIPNDAVIVSGADALLRDWGDAPVGEPVRIEGGRPVPIRAGRD